MAQRTWIDTVDIARPADRVWAMLADPTLSPAWIQGLTSVEMIGPTPVAVGTKFRATRSVGGRSTTETIEVTELETGRRYAVAAGLMNGGIFLRISYTLTSIPSGTRVESLTEAATRSFGSHFYFGMFWKAVVANDTGNLQRLKAKVESGP